MGLGGGGGGGGLSNPQSSNISRHGSLEIEFERRPFCSSNFTTSYSVHNSTSIQSLSTHSKSGDLDSSRYGSRGMGMVNHPSCEITAVRVAAPLPIAPPPTHREEYVYEEQQHQHHMMGGMQEVDEISPNQVNRLTQDTLKIPLQDFLSSSQDTPSLTPSSIYFNTISSLSIPSNTISPLPSQYPPPSLF